MEDQTKPMESKPPTNSASPSTVERRKARLARHIELTGLRLLADRPYSEVSIEEIAREADISTRTFFRYFATKEALLNVAHEDHMRFLREALERRPKDEAPLEAITQALMDVARTHAQDNERSRNWIKAASSPGAPRAGEFRLELVRALVPEVAARLGMKEDDLLPELLVSTVLEISRVGISHAISSKRGYDESTLPKCLALISDMFSKPAVTKKPGRKI